MESYKTKGTCAREIKYEIENDTLKNVEFVSGCPGNLLGIQALVEGLTIDEVIEKFDGIGCGSKTTSCPDQLAKALKLYKTTH
jgi:uncharacterized protein (TIGR03905 family)